MKALLIIDSDELAATLKRRLEPLGFSLIRYRNPIKAMDNLEEIDAEAVFISAEEFPRHWKTCLQLIRSNRSKEECVSVLLRGERFPFDEAAKAVFLGVNGVSRENLENPDEADRMEQVLRRYLSVGRAAEASPVSSKAQPAVSKRASFTFSHPEHYTIVSGLVLELSADGLIFRPDVSELARDLGSGTELAECCLKLDADIYSCSAKVDSSAAELRLSFVSPGAAMLEAIALTLEKVSKQ
jgi:hypothetical protein